MLKTAGKLSPVAYAGVDKPPVEPSVLKILCLILSLVYLFPHTLQKPVNLKLHPSRPQGEIVPHWLLEIGKMGKNS